ncbi:hypothetical protein [Oceanithermus sp.]
MRRVLALLSVAFSLAWAAGCAGRDVVLELERPPLVLAGDGFELNGEALVFSDRACLEDASGTLEAERIVYDRARGVLEAERVHGTVQGWRVVAERLIGDAERLVFERATFSRDDATLTAARATVEGGTVRLEAVAAVTSRYRFRAERGRIEDDVFVAEGVWSTPCACGQAIELLAEQATFRFADGRLLLDRSTFRLYGASLARPEELRVDLNEPLDLQFPLRFSYGNGWNFGVEGLPLPAEGEAFGRWRTRLTLMAENVGGALVVDKTEAVHLAVDYRGPDGSVRFGLRPVRRWDGAAWTDWVEPDVRLVRGPFSFRVGWSSALERTTAAVALAPTWKGGWGRLIAYGRFADETNTGLSAGVAGALSLPSRREGPFSIRLELPFSAAFYPDAAPYLWGGGRAELGYGDLLLGLELYRAAGVPRYGYEARTAREAVRFEAGRALRASLGYSRDVRYDLAAGAVSGENRSYRLELAYDGAAVSFSAKWLRKEDRDPVGSLLGTGERWTLAAARGGDGLELAWWRGWDGGALDYSELRLGYRPAAPDCAGDWAIAPSLGWDLLQGRVSRAGLELTLNDCCFTWTLSYQAVYVPQLPGEAAQQNVRFGVRLR